MKKFTTCYVWINAICINQADESDEERQVKRTDAVYGLAQTVTTF